MVDVEEDVGRHRAELREQHAGGARGRGDEDAVGFDRLGAAVVIDGEVPAAAIAARHLLQLATEQQAIAELLSRGLHELRHAFLEGHDRHLGRREGRPPSALRFFFIAFMALKRLPCSCSISQTFGKAERMPMRRASPA